MKKFDDVHNALTDLILQMINMNEEESNVNECYDIWTDGSMILSDNKDTHETLVKAFDMLGLAFTTGEPDDGDVEDRGHYYIDFE